MTFKQAIEKQAQTILKTQGEEVTLNNANRLNVVFFPLVDEKYKDYVDNGKRINELARGIIYPASLTLVRGDLIKQASGNVWAVLPFDKLTQEGDAVDGLKKTRVVFKGVVNE